MILGICIGLIFGVVSGFLLGGKIAIRIVKYNMRCLGWSEEAIKAKCFKKFGN